MRGYLKRLLATGAAYQFGDIVAKGIALITIPLYTRHISPAGYGAANSLLTAVILASIFLRVGVGEAFIRFYFDDDDLARRDRIARTATATVAWTTSAAALLAVVFSGALSRLILGYHDPLLLDCAIVGSSSICGLPWRLRKNPFSRRTAFAWTRRETCSSRCTEGAAGFKPERKMEMTATATTATPPIISRRLRRFLACPVR